MIRLERLERLEAISLGIQPKTDKTFDFLAAVVK